MKQTRYLRFLLCICIYLTGPILIPRAVAGNSTLPAVESALILEAGRFKSLQSAKEVPADVLKKCFPNGAPADPGKPWNPTDVVQDPSLPFSRVIWLVTDGAYWLISWEHGGIAHTSGFMMIAKTRGTAPTVVWDAGPATKTLETFPEFQEYVRLKGLFRDVSSVRP